MSNNYLAQQSYNELYEQLIFFSSTLRFSDLFEVLSKIITSPLSLLSNTKDKQILILSNAIKMYIDSALNYICELSDLEKAEREVNKLFVNYIKEILLNKIEEFLKTISETRIIIKAKFIPLYDKSNTKLNKPLSILYLLYADCLYSSIACIENYPSSNAYEIELNEFKSELKEILTRTYMLSDSYFKPYQEEYINLVNSLVNYYLYVEKDKHKAGVLLNQEIEKIYSYEEGNDAALINQEKILIENKKILKLLQIKNGLLEE